MKRREARPSSNNQQRKGHIVTPGRQTPETEAERKARIRALRAGKRP